MAHDDERASPSTSPRSSSPSLTKNEVTYTEHDKITRQATISPPVEISTRQVLLAALVAILCMSYASLHLWWGVVEVVEQVRQDKAFIGGLEDAGPLLGFKGARECGIRFRKTYLEDEGLGMCGKKDDVLHAIGKGKRDSPGGRFSPEGCNYRWLSIHEICEILSRFDGVIFAGDAALLPVYAAFNMLLRQDLAHGAVESWRLDDEQRERCRCNDQWLDDNCVEYIIRASEEIDANTGIRDSPTICRGTPHIFFTDPCPSLDKKCQDEKIYIPSNFNRIKLVPLIHSVSQGISLSRSRAVEAMSFIKEDVVPHVASDRPMPLLWLGPNAVGHHRGRNEMRRASRDFLREEHSRALESFTVDMEKEARKREYDVLNLWNFTVEASTLVDQRLGFGMEVVLAEAMMVLNWMSML